MSTPPKYPFRSRREIHSGQRKVYSDAPNEEQLSAPSDPTSARGSRGSAQASSDPTSVRGSVRRPQASSDPTSVRGSVRRPQASSDPTSARGGERRPQASSDPTSARGSRESAQASSDPTSVRGSVRRPQASSDPRSTPARETSRRRFTDPDPTQTPLQGVDRASTTKKSSVRGLWRSTRTMPDPTPTPDAGVPSVADDDDESFDTSTDFGFDALTDPGEETATVSGFDAIIAGTGDEGRSRQHSEDPSETTGMRSRRIAAERHAARKRKRRRRIRSFFVLLLVIGLVSGAGYVAYSQLMNTSMVASDDFPGPGTDPILVTIDDQATGRDIGRALHEAGVVKSVGAFVRQYEKNSAARTINPGTYRFKRQMSAADALAVMLDPMNRVESTITVLAGERVSAIKRRIVDVMDVSSADVDKAFADTAAIGLPAEAGGSAEGWLHRGEYKVEEGDTPTAVIARMVKATIDELDALGVPAADRETVLIKASIVEGEMGNNPKYMPKVARVIENRLVDDKDTHGVLGMDSTTLYGAGKESGLPSQADLDNDNPYNTRLHAGLPPTPINQPSADAIKAVLNPEAGDWLYFVTVDLNSGETLFAATADEHEKNKAKLDAYCTKHPIQCSPQS